ncbi:MAG TPA: OmpA family protein [Tepidisphaeraceae bacterium]|nr:OmpA family protein [Tepidisphaeraceae bacterium]
MRTIRMGAVVVMVMCMVAAGAGCKSAMHDENLAFHTQNREQQERIRLLEAERDARLDPSAVAQRDAQIAAQDAKIAELEKQLREPAPAQGGTAATDPGIAGIEMSMNQATGEMTVNLPGDVLFDAGRATLKESAKSTLNKVAAMIKKEYPGKKVLVDGHTDSDPITKTKSMWKDNLDLSAERARVVGRYLADQGVPAKQIGTRGFGDTKPRGGDKSRNRRVEVVVSTR